MNNLPEYECKANSRNVVYINHRPTSDKRQCRTWYRYTESNPQGREMRDLHLELDIFRAALYVQHKTD
jgi:hypothetical protein